MKYFITCLAIAAIITSCASYPAMNGSGYANQYDDTLITQSLFNDRASSISEENIQRILSGNYKLPHMEVTPCANPLITAKPSPAASYKARRKTAGNAVGSPLPPLRRRYGPVTTDPLRVGVGHCHTPCIHRGDGKSTTGAIRGLSHGPSGSAVVHLRIRRR